MSQRNSAYGMLAGMTTAATLQPLQNIKVAIMIPPSNMLVSNNFILNLVNAFRFLLKEGGVPSFYKGLLTNVIKTGFASAIYFCCLRGIENMRSKEQKSAISSFFASACGRIVSAVASNPLSVVETRYQLAGKERWNGSIAKSLWRVVKGEGVEGLFKGGLAMCYKEGFFAGLYYALYRQGKSVGMSSIVAGIGAGILATTVTHPFQLIRTRLQVQSVITSEKVSVSIHQELMDLARRGLAFRGLAPRIIKKPLSNTIAFMLFEYLEKDEKQL